MSEGAQALKKSVVAALAFAVVGGVIFYKLAERPPRGMRSLPASEAAAALPPLVDEAQRQARLTGYAGKVVVLNLWASWCAPCINELPSLDRLAALLPADRFAVLAVSQDSQGAAAARPVFDRLGLRNIALHVDPARQFGQVAGSRGLPTTLILGVRGESLAYREGEAVWDSDEMVGYLRGLYEKSRQADRSGQAEARVAGG